MISQRALQDKFFPILERDGKEYAKFKQVIARVAEGGEKVVSETSDGVETENTASPGEYIVVVTAESFRTYSGCDKNVIPST